MLFRSKPIKISSSLEGVHNVKNILSACAVHYCLGQNLQDFSKSISLSKLDNLRQVKYKWLKGSTLIDDSYNASPESMTAALEVLSLKKTTLNSAVLSDMLELGKHSKSFHSSLAKKILQAKICARRRGCVWTAAGSCGQV